VRPLETSYHLEKLPRIFLPPGLSNEMVTIPAAANNAISYISRIRNVYFGSFSGCAALTSCTACHPGRYAHHTNASTQCEPCAAGRFSNLSGVTSCGGVCQSGTYAPPGSISCSYCTQKLLVAKDRIVDAAKFGAKLAQCSGTAQHVQCQGQLSYGCTDSGAHNFNACARIDNGTCVYECGALLNLLT
jgi:hypothetical protein